MDKGNVSKGLKAHRHSTLHKKEEKNLWTENILKNYYPNSLFRIFKTYLTRFIKKYLKILQVVLYYSSN